MNIFGLRFGKIYCSIIYILELDFRSLFFLKKIQLDIYVFGFVYINNFITRSYV